MNADDFLDREMRFIGLRRLASEDGASSEAWGRAVSFVRLLAGDAFYLLDASSEAALTPASAGGALLRTVGPGCRYETTVPVQLPSGEILFSSALQLPEEAPFTVRREGADAVFEFEAEERRQRCSAVPLSFPEIVFAEDSGRLPSPDAARLLASIDRFVAETEPEGCPFAYDAIQLGLAPGRFWGFATDGASLSVMSVPAETFGRALEFAAPACAVPPLKEFLSCSGADVSVRLARDASSSVRRLVFESDFGRLLLSEINRPVPDWRLRLKSQNRVEVHASKVAAAVRSLPPGADLVKAAFKFSDSSLLLESGGERCSLPMVSVTPPRLRPVEMVFDRRRLDLLLEGWPDGPATLGFDASGSRIILRSDHRDFLVRALLAQPPRT